MLLYLFIIFNFYGYSFWSFRSSDDGITTILMGSSDTESDAGSVDAIVGRNSGEGILEEIIDGRYSVFCFNCKRCSNGEVCCLTAEISIVNFFFSASISS